MRILRADKVNKIQKENVSSTERKVLSTVLYRLETTQGKYLLRVPKGAIYNGASIPKWAWSIVGHPFGSNEGAALAHDYLYSTKALNRKQADVIYKKLSLENKFFTWIQYLAIRLFGKKYWHAVKTEDRHRSIEVAKEARVFPIILRASNVSN